MALIRTGQLDHLKALEKTPRPASFFMGQPQVPCEGRHKGLVSWRPSVGGQMWVQRPIVLFSMHLSSVFIAASFNDTLQSFKSDIQPPAKEKCFAYWDHIGKIHFLRSLVTYCDLTIKVKSIMSTDLGILSGTVCFSWHLRILSSMQVC